MASVKIENLVEKYFQAETSIAEKNELRNYFSSQNVVAHLEQYKPLFGYLSLAAAPQFKREFLPQSKKKYSNVGVNCGFGCSFAGNWDLCLL